MASPIAGVVAGIAGLPSGGRQLMFETSRGHAQEGDFTVAGGQRGPIHLGDTHAPAFARSVISYAQESASSSSSSSSNLLLKGFLPGLALATVRRGWASASGRNGRTVARGRNYEKNIKNQKAKGDAVLGKVKDRHLKKIILAVREGGPEEDLNAPLARLIKAALKDNVARSTIDKRIDKFVKDKEEVVECDLAGFGPGGVAIVVTCVSCNVPQLRTDVATAFKNVGKQTGTDGSTDHAFTKRGIIRFEDADEEAVVEASLEADVEDVVAGEDSVVEAITEPDSLDAAVASIASQGLEPSSYDIVMSPVTEVDLNEENTYELKRLVHLLNDLDDVQDVHHNGKFSPGVELTLSNYGIPVTYAKSDMAKA